MVERDKHDYSEENFDIELYKASINVTSVEAVNAGDNTAMFIVNYEFYAEYADGGKWVKDTAIVVGEPSPELLTDFKKRLLGTVADVRRELKRTKLNGERAE